MNQDKKTIRLANGLAEEGDKTILECRDCFIEGFLVKGENSCGWEFVPFEETEPSYAEEDNEEFREKVFIAFSPTDAIEAVEEEIEFRRACRVSVDEIAAGEIEGKDERAKYDAVMSALQNVKQRVQQKRKGQ